MRAFDAFAAGFVIIAIVAVVLSKGSATTNAITTSFSVLTSMIKMAMNPLATNQQTGVKGASPLLRFGEVPQQSPFARRDRTESCGGHRFHILYLAGSEDRTSS